MIIAQNLSLLVKSQRCDDEIVILILVTTICFVFVIIFMS